MSSTAKSAFVGYSYQLQVAILSVFLLEEDSLCIERIRAEIDADKHNFDDILWIRKRLKKNVFIQTKNYSNNNMITFDSHKFFLMELKWF